MWIYDSVAKSRLSSEFFSRSIKENVATDFELAIRAVSSAASFCANPRIKAAAMLE